MTVFGDGVFQEEVKNEALRVDTDPVCVHLIMKRLRHRYTPQEDPVRHRLPTSSGERQPYDTLI